jgi:hypothetical protein
MGNRLLILFLCCLSANHIATSKEQGGRNPQASPRHEARRTGPLPTASIPLQLRLRCTSSRHFPNTPARFSAPAAPKLKSPLRSWLVSAGPCASTPASLSAFCPFISQRGSSMCSCGTGLGCQRCELPRTNCFERLCHCGRRTRRLCSIGQRLAGASCPLPI